MEYLLILVAHLVFTLSDTSCAALDSISVNQTIKNGQTIVSATGDFELGFFSPGDSNNWYLGIWYSKSTDTVVWVANRETPLTNSSGVLTLNQDGILELVNQTNGVIWSSNISRMVSSPVAQLLDSGNLIVKEGIGSNQEDAVWRSFDYPSNTLMAGMKFGRNIVTGLDRYLTSWKSQDNPAPGFFTYRLDPTGFPQLILRNGSSILFSSGPWNGVRFSGFPQLTPNPVYSFGFVFNQYEMYYHFELLNSTASFLVLNQNGLAQRYTWVTNGWVLYSSAQTDDCDTYARCGANGVCNINSSPKCACLTGFVPKYPQDWNIADWSEGCVRRTELKCGGGDKFLKFSDAKLPNTRYSWYDRNMSLLECEKMCLKNCSCTAYSNLDIQNGGSGCLLWFGDLMDIRTFIEHGQDLYIRLDASEVEAANSTTSAKRRTTIIVSSVIPALLLLGLAYICINHKKNGKYCGYLRKGQSEDLDLPSYEFADIAKATNNFSLENKLGEGGFGPVYKGVTKNGQEIAVKRLSENSRQGPQEFKNEATCLAKLQHRNLVKLVGYCIHMDERMLIYEFLRNRSLDRLIFDQGGVSMDWETRFTVINGIASGLLYLHRDSRLRIIHRDLKAENILLDDEMTPKISDFGLARSFGGNEGEANTKKVVGTYGYMSPEYAVHGHYSIKSDVFSFGVLVIEIVHGKRNRGFSHPTTHLSLLEHAWTLFKEDRIHELFDPRIAKASNLSEALISVHVALLCVQHSPGDRPDMSAVMMMLGSEVALPHPKQPGYYSGDSGPFIGKDVESSCGVSVSDVQAR